jgi:hypothetical protein
MGVDVHQAEAGARPRVWHDGNPRVARVTDLIADRYGRTRRSRWPIALIAVVAAAGLVWVVWAVWAQSNPKVTSALLTSQIGSHSATATLKIRLSDSDVHPTCVVRAYAEDHTPVGELSFEVDQPPKRSFTITKSFRTERRATAVESVGCTAPGQSHPR